MLNVFVQWKDRSHAETPEWLLVLFTLCGVIVPVFYLYVLKLVAPTWLAIAARVVPGEWGWQGLLLTIVLGMLGLLAWNTAALALHCASQLRDRWSN